MKKNNAGGLFANKNKGKRFNFEGKNTGTDQLVRGEVVAKDEEPNQIGRASCRERV